jgi:iron complex outermembrane receptor protein
MIKSNIGFEDLNIRFASPRTSRMARRALAATLLASGMATASAVAAEDQSSAKSGGAREVAQAAPPTVGAVEEVVVTAQLRAEDIETVPVAITAISADRLQKSQFTSLSDIQYLAAGVTYRPGSSADYKIRGVGTQAFDYAIESSVGLVIDGVVQGLPRSPNLATLADVSQIEVLRGPQGTLFGKNASAGIISVTTNKPKPGEFENISHISYGSRNETLANTTFNVPFTDDLTGRFTASYKHRDGFIHNLYNNTNLYEVDQTTLYAKLLWQPIEHFSAYVTADSQRVKNNSATQWTIGKLAPGPSVLRDRLDAYGIVPGPKNLDVALDGPNYQNIYLRGISGTLEYTLDDITFTSITAYRKLNVASQLELDSSDLPRYNTNLARQRTTQASQEFRITSPTGQFLEYVGGLYFIDVNSDVTQDQWGTLDLAPYDSPIWAGGITVSSNRGRLTYDTRNRSYAAYANLTAHATDRLDFFGGMRWTNDYVYSLEYVAQVPKVCQTSYVTTGICQPTPFLSPQNLRVVRHGDWTAKGGVKYNFDDDIMSYFTVARGYKGPTVNNVTGAATLVEPETNLAFELGVKTRLFDDRLTLNADLFKTHYTNFQTQTYDTKITPFGFILGNAGGMESRGFEFDFTASITDELTFSGNAAYVNSYFTDYQLFCNVGTCTGMNNSQGVFTARLLDAKGMTPVNAPKFSYTLTAGYHRALTDKYDIDANVNWAWRSMVWGYVADPNTIIDPYGLLNVNIGVGPKDGSWRFGVFSRNLLNQYYIAGYLPTILNTLGYSIVPDGDGGQFRTVGLTLDFKM